jgi:antitoxin ParD1/3/4
MANIERMTVVFPEPMADQLRAAVEAGEYASTSEAVRDAVRLWSGRRRMMAQDLEQLRRAWDEGKASGRPRL